MFAIAKNLPQNCSVCHWVGFARDEPYRRGVFPRSGEWQHRLHETRRSRVQSTAKPRRRYRGQRRRGRQSVLNSDVATKCLCSSKTSPFTNAAAPRNPIPRPHRFVDPPQWPPRPVRCSRRQTRMATSVGQVCIRISCNTTSVRQVLTSANPDGHLGRSGAHVGKPRWPPQSVRCASG